MTRDYENAEVANIAEAYANSLRKLERLAHAERLLRERPKQFHYVHAGKQSEDCQACAEFREWDKQARAFLAGGAGAVAQEKPERIPDAVRETLLCVLHHADDCGAFRVTHAGLAAALTWVEEQEKAEGIDNG